MTRDRSLWTLVAAAVATYPALALLGLVTILVPCGVTLSVEALALASGSALSGAATMAVFVAGTTPLFALLGYAARRAATAWRGRLAVATGLVVLGMGLYTLNGGLTLAGSPLAARHLAQTLGFSAPPAVADPSVVSVTAGRQQVIVTAPAAPHRLDSLGDAGGRHAGRPRPKRRRWRPRPDRQGPGNT